MENFENKKITATQKNTELKEEAMNLKEKLKDAEFEKELEINHLGEDNQTKFSQQIHEKTIDNIQGDILINEAKQVLNKDEEKQKKYGLGENEIPGHPSIQEKFSEN